MSKIKSLLEDREDFVDFIDDDYWCHYAGMPSPSFYQDPDESDVG